IYVGKLPDRHTLQQEEINAVLVERGREGKIVCRLKGGDPFVFGRGGEEALDLVEAGIPFEVVPGVTAAVAAPGYAGIPVTHRAVAVSAAIITGHEDPTKDESQINWEHLATGVDTLVFFMGIGNLAMIVDKLVSNGRAAETPVALIHRGTQPAQYVVTGTLDTIVALAEEHEIKPPSLIVVGEVVALREQLKWFETRPLFGKRVLVTRTREQASSLSGSLERLGAISIELPVIAVEAVDDYSTLDDSLKDAAGFDWLVFTSVNGVKAVLARLSDLGLDIRDLKGPRVAAIGPGTAGPLKDAGIRVDVVPERFIAEHLAEALIETDISGKRVLIARAEVARQVLPEMLREAGADVTVAPCYRTVPAPGAGEKVIELVESGELDVVTFASSSQVTSFCECLEGRDVPELLKDVTVACIGPITAKTAVERGLAVAVSPDQYTISGLVEALVEYTTS
ncbi:MAG TPA: uroporphyrinogen-III C-methyltransferase, partial [Armatimonadota bacterium]|nr:uroporphyrinogen-III C-methyltransferase [Armatimonadota bacterium]